MLTATQQLEEKLLHAITAAFPHLQIDTKKLGIAPAKQDEFGHYQSNIALKLASVLHDQPRVIAQAIVAQLDNTTPSLLAHFAVAGAGFINLTLAPTYVAQRIENMLRSTGLGVPLTAHPQHVIVDFSSPNTAKEMHVGHLRSTIIGDCLSRLFETLGYRVLRLNHIGDWGTAFGMLIAHLQETLPDAFHSATNTTLTQLVSGYREAKQRFDDDPAFKKKAHLAVIALQQGDPDTLQAWRIICDISRKAYAEIYHLLDVDLIERGESYYNPLLAPTITDLENKGLVQLSNGAKCIFLPGFNNREGEALPFIIQKSDGGFNYATTDMASIRHRIEVEHADRIIYITDAGQATHFAMLFKAAELAGYLDPHAVTVNHLPLGLVLGADGKKFKTRSGHTERLIDLLHAAIDKAKNILNQRHTNLSGEALQQSATVLGINAIKYADLSCHRTNDYTFSYDRMLQFEGNTAAYLMYVYARINSIKQDIGVDVTTLIHTAPITLSHPSEVLLAVHLEQFGDVLWQIADDLLPHHLTDYLYALAGRFNVFYRDCRVKDDPQQTSRLLLCEAVAGVMHQGLTILGLKLLEKM